MSVGKIFLEGSKKERYLREYTDFDWMILGKKLPLCLYL